MTEKNHWLYGKDKRKFKIDKETDCSKCLYKKLCFILQKSVSYEILCKNYKFGRSDYEGCHSCLHKFTRFDKETIPCFICKYFKEKK